MCSGHFESRLGNSRKAPSISATVTVVILLPFLPLLARDSVGEIWRKKSLTSSAMVARAAALRTNINIDGRPLPTQKRRRTSSKHCAPHVLHASAPHFHLPVN